MHSVLKIPVIRSLHGRGLLLPATLLLVVAGILVHGALNRQTAVEAARTPKTEAPPATHGGNRPDVEKTILAYESDFWLQLAQSVRSKIDLVSSKHIPAVHVSPTLAVASITAAEELIRDHQKQQLVEERAARRSRATSADGTPGESDGEAAGGRDPSAENDASNVAAALENADDLVRLVAVDARLGVALFELPEETANPFSLVNPANLPPGSFLAAITVEADKRLRISPGYLVSAEKTGAAEQGAESFEVSFDLGDAPETVAVVDLDGNLAGLAVRARGKTRFLSAPAVSRLVKRLTEQPPCYSIEVAEVPASAKKLLGLRGGVFVERVLEDSFKPSPSIRAGDVISRWAGKSVDTVEQFRELYRAAPPGSIARYAVRRGDRSISGGTIMPGRDCRPVGEPPLSLVKMGVVLEWSERPETAAAGVAADWRVTALIEDAPARESGLQLDDRILLVNGRPINLRNAETSFSAFEKRNRSLVLSVQRSDRVKLLAVSPDGLEAP